MAGEELAVTVRPITESDEVFSTLSFCDKSFDECRKKTFFHDSCQCHNSTSFNANSSGCGGTSRLNFLKHLFFFVICRVQVPGV